MSTPSWYQRPDMMVGLSAVLVSLVALGVGIYSAYIDRSAAKATVWPSLMMARSYNETEFKYIVLNQGTGPAVISYAKLSINNNPIAGWGEMLDKMSFPDGRFAQSHIGGGVIRAAQEVVAFKTQDTRLIKTLVNEERLSAEICYCSIYKDCWLSTLDGLIQEVEFCVVDDKTRFKQ